MAIDKEMVVEVAYARPDEQLVLETRVATDATVEHAVRVSGILERFPEIDLRTNKVGIFGKLTSLSTRLRGQDRVEIYRPLIADPKQTRKQRAAKHKSKGTNGPTQSRAGYSPSMTAMASCSTSYASSPSK